MPPQPTVWEADAHTLAKQRLYKRYFDAWFLIMQQAFDGGITYAEGFAGPGEYADGSWGSPVNALHAALTCRCPPRANRPIRFAYVDERKDRVEHLRNLLYRRLGTSNGQVLANRGVWPVVRHGKCEETLPRVLTQLQAWVAPCSLSWTPGVRGCRSGCSNASRRAPVRR